MTKTAVNPTGDRKKESADLQVAMMLSAVVILNEMGKNLFEEY